MGRPLTDPATTIPRCQRCGARARFVVTHRDGSEAFLCVDDFSALMRNEEVPIAAVRGVET